MDSLTQIVLGAAVGETVLGKKIGNRAMVWGAIGGTIPDLDVLNNLWMGELDAMCSHRGITHSIFFSFVAPILFAWLLTYLYQSGAYRSKTYKWLVAGVNIAILALLVFGLWKASESFLVLAIAAAFAGYLIWRLYRYYLSGELRDVDVPFRDWYILFFLAFITHIALDSFTAYGTQVFLPFSNMRVAFNTISVADPLYTLPFLICLVVAAFSRRSSRPRAIANWTGIVISSIYLLLTVFNHRSVSSTFKSALEHRGIEANRTLVNPTILQNALWNCVAEGDSAYFVGLYSIFDSDKNLHYLNVLKKDHQARSELAEYEEYERLRWFSNDYLVVTPSDTAYELFDLRFGPLGDTIRAEEDFVFRFRLTPEEDGAQFRQIRSQPEDFGKAWNAFTERVRGR